MNKQISILNKISSLVLANPVKRRRLFDLLGSSGGGTAFWISGPGGSGKSTLVASYLEEYHIPAVWYQVDALDRDPATSFYYLGEAVRALVPEAEEQLPLLTPEYLPGLDSFLLQFFERFYQVVPPGAWLVFDNVQDAPSPSLLPQLLAAAVQQLPQTCRLAIVSRDEPLPALARFLANRVMTPIGWDDLAFTVEEFCQLLDKEQIPGGLGQAEQLHGLTGGWVAGAILMLINLRGGRVGDRLPLHVSPENVYAYFAGEVLEKIDQKTRNFFLETSQLPFMTADLVKEVTSVPDVALLDELLQKNFFLQRRYQSSAIYQYHPLFHAFLDSTVQRLFAPEHLAELRLRSARALENRGLAAQAVDIYGRIGAHDDICAIILAQARTLVSEGRHRTLANWLGLLPAAVVDGDPYLLYWQGVAAMIDAPLESRLSCTRAYHVCRERGDYPGQLLCWSTLVEGFVMMRTGFDELDFWIAEGERLGKEFEAIENTEAAALFSANMLIALLLRHQGHADLPLWQERCEKLLDRCTSVHVMAILVSGLFWSYHYLGDVRKAGFVEARLNLVLGQPGIPAMGRLMIHMLLALAAVGRGDHQRCLQMVGDTLAIADKTGIHTYDLMVVSFGVYTGLTTGDMPLARRYLDRLAPLLLPHALWDHAQHHFLEAWYCLENMELAEARNLLLKARDFIDSCGNPYTIACVDILHACLHLDYGHPEEARKHLEVVQSNERLGHNRIIRLVVQLGLADCAFSAKDPGGGASHFRRALDLIHENGLTLPFPMVNRRLGHVVAQALDEGFGDAAVYDLINRWKLKPLAPEMVGRLWPWPLRLLTFGGLELVENGEALQPSVKPPRKLFELLILLITAKRPGVLKENAAYRLWPDADGDRAIQSLNTALHRLRKLLVEEDVILLENGRLLLNPRKCWVDCWHFEWLEQRAAATAEPGAAGRFLLGALRLYRGDFAPEHQGLELATGYAEKLRQAWRGMIAMARDLLAGGKLRPDQAEELGLALAAAEELAQRRGEEW